ncbi:MAG TPA: hypothetical protein V6C69_01770 [Trichormus sp.]|jgi:hypothetical protein
MADPIREVVPATSSPAALTHVPRGSEPGFNKDYAEATKINDKPLSLPFVSLVDEIDQHTTKALPGDIATKLPLVAKELELSDAAKNPNSADPLHFSQADIRIAVGIATTLATAKDDPAAASQTVQAQIKSMFAKMANNDTATEEEKVNPAHVVQLVNKYAGTKLNYAPDATTADGKKTQLITFPVREHNTEQLSDNLKATVTVDHRTAPAISATEAGMANEDIQFTQLNHGDYRRIQEDGPISFSPGKDLGKVQRELKTASLIERNAFQARDPFTQKMLEPVLPKTQPQSGATQE